MDYAPYPVRIITPESFKNQVLVLISAPLVEPNELINELDFTKDSDYWEIHPLSVWEEIDAIVKAIKRIIPPVQFEINVQIATANGVRMALSGTERPLIIHFIGHGMQDGGFIGLVIENEAGQAELMSAAELGSLLDPFDDPPCYLAVLNACHSEALADVMLNAGVPHVIAINAEDRILDTAARTFTRHFYRPLLSGRLSIRQAFEIGRGSVRNTFGIDQNWDEITFTSRRLTEPPKFCLLPEYSMVHENVMNYDRFLGGVIPPLWNRTNLTPRSHDPLVGRQKDLHKLASCLLEARGYKHTHRCLLIKGMPGIGKTVLATALGRWQHERTRWDDGVWLVELRNISNAAQARARIANELNISQKTVQNYSITSQFFAWDGLLILDDLDTLIRNDPVGLENLLRGLLGGRSLQLVLTSRDDLPIVTYLEYPLERITDEAALEAFKQYAPPFDKWRTDLTVYEDDIEYLLSFLQGYPFPIRLAATYMKKRRLSIHELCERLRTHPMEVLRDPGAIPTRDSVLAITLDLSYNALPVYAREMLHVLSLFPSGMTKDIAKFLGGIEKVYDLETLLQYSMAEERDRFEEYRITLPEPARKYVEEKQSEDIMMHYGPRVLSYYQDFVDDLFNKRRQQSIEVDSEAKMVQRRRRFFEEEANIIHFLDWGYFSEIPDNTVCRSARLTALLASHLELLSYAFRDILPEYLDLAEQAARRTRDKVGEAQIYEARGDFHRALENYSNSLSSYQKALTYYSLLKDHLSVGNVYIKMGKVCSPLNDEEAAISNFEKAIEAFLHVQAHSNAAYGFELIGEIHHRESELKKAISKYEEAIRFYALAEQLFSAAILHERIGDIYSKQEKIQNALASYQEALQMVSKLSNNKYAARLQELIGNSHLKLEDREAALVAYQEAIDLYDALHEVDQRNLLLKRVDELKRTQK